MSCPDENQLALLGEDALDTLARATIEAHLDTCSACTLLIRELGAVAPGSERPRVPDRYRVIGRLGAGGMGEVWRAEDRELRREVALKLVRAGGDGQDHERRARLLREARLLAGIKHPNVVAVHDVGEYGDELYLAMELVEGQTAAATVRLRSGQARGAPRPVGEVLAIWRDAGKGLAALHAAGVVHRDVKPENVLVARDGRVVVTDLGLGTIDRAFAVTTLTETGQLLGTPAYMAPEQLHGEPATARADQFAWCVSVWEAITGSRPFAGTTIAALAIAMTRPLPKPRGEHAALLAVLARGLEPDPAGRWPDMPALLDAVDRAAGGARAGPPRAAVAVAAGVIVLAAGGALAWTLARDEPAAAPPVTATPIAAVDAAAIATVTPPDAAPPAPVTATPPAPAPKPTRKPKPAATARVDQPRPPLPAPVGNVGPDGLTPNQRGELLKRTPKWRVDNLSEFLRKHDAKGCFAELDSIGPLPPGDVANSAEHMRALCEMDGGDCQAGRRRLTALANRRGQKGDVARWVDSFDASWCPIDAPGSAAQKYARLDNRLLMAMHDKKPCMPWVDRAEKIGVPEDQRKRFAGLATTCAVAAKQCKRALPYYLEMVGANDTTRQIYIDNFGKTYEACAGKDL